jgi:hypothetical protein
MEAQDQNIRYADHDNSRNSRHQKTIEFTSLLLFFFPNWTQNPKPQVPDTTWISRDSGKTEVNRENTPQLTPLFVFMFSSLTQNPKPGGDRHNTGEFKRFQGQLNSVEK